MPEQKPFLEKILNNGEKSLFKIYGLFFLLTTIIFILYIVFKEKTTTDFSESFLISLFASFLEDFIFFVIIGYITFRLGQRNPEHEIFEKRASFLANSPKIKDKFDLRSNYFHEIRKLLAYTYHDRITISIDSYSEKDNAVQVSLLRQSKIRNMTNDTDPIFSVELITESDLKIGEFIGVIREFSFIDKNKRETHMTDIEGEFKDFRNEFSKDYTYSNIGDEITLRYHFTINNYLGNDVTEPKGRFFISIPRYSENVNVVFWNSVDKLSPFYVSCKFTDRKSSNKITQIERREIPVRKEVKLIEDIFCCKDDKIELYLHQK